MLMRQPLEHDAKLGCDPLFDLVASHRLVEEDGEGGHSTVGDAAGDDQVETGEIGRDVEGEAVAGHPAGDADANRGQLVVSTGAGPHAGQSFDAAGVDAVARGGPNQHFLEVAYVAMHVAAVRLEVEDGIPDDLAGPMVGDVAAAAGLVDFDAAPSQRLVGGETVRS